MTLPPAADAAMCFIGSLLVGFPHRTSDGKLVVIIPGIRPQSVPGEVLDRLEQDGLLDLSGDVPQVTERGKYRFQKWGERHFDLKRQHRRRS